MNLTANCVPWVGQWLASTQLMTYQTHESKQWIFGKLSGHPNYDNWTESLVLFLFDEWIEIEDYDWTECIYKKQIYLILFCVHIFDANLNWLRQIDTSMGTQSRFDAEIMDDAW